MNSEGGKQIAKSAIANQPGKH